MQDNEKLVITDKETIKYIKRVMLEFSDVEKIEILKKLDDEKTFVEIEKILNEKLYQEVLYFLDLFIFKSFISKKTIQKVNYFILDNLEYFLFRRGPIYLTVNRIQKTFTREEAIQVVKYVEYYISKNKQANIDFENILDLVKIYLSHDISTTFIKQYISNSLDNSKEKREILNMYFRNSTLDSNLIVIYIKDNLSKYLDDKSNKIIKSLFKGV